jgi:hypothetical protein
MQSMRLVEHDLGLRGIVPNGTKAMMLTLTVLIAGLAVSHGRALDAAPPTGEPLMLARIAELTSTVDALTSRVAELETRVARSATDRAQAGQRVTAPFEVVDKSGKVILSVSDGTYGDATTRGRVHIGRGTGENFGLWVRGGDGNPAVVVREQASGVGGVFVMDKKGISRVALSAEDDRGITILNSSSKEIASLGPDPKSKASGMVRVVDEAGGALLDVGGNGRSIAGPFVVTDKGGKPILSVSDTPYDSDPKKGRIQVGRGNGDNYGIWVRRADQTLATTMGETKDGDGLVTVRDRAGKLRAEVWAANGFNVYDKSGAKPLASIAPNDAGTAIRMKITGQVQLLDAKDQVTFEAGENKQGGGGLAHVYGKDGKIRAELDDGGIYLVSTAGKHVVMIELNPDGTGGVLDIRGQLHVVDAGGGTTVEMGTAPSGVGVIRVGPRYRCGPGVPMVAGIPSCMVGIK